MACADEGIRLPDVVGLPVLFQVDKRLMIRDGQQWILDCGHSYCAAIPPMYCVRHGVRPFIPKDLPLQRDPKTGHLLLPNRKKFALGGSSSSFGGGDGYSGGGGHACGGHH